MSDKLDKLYGMKEWSRKIISVPSIPVGAQMKGEHLQLLFPGGYTSTEVNLYAMEKADRKAWEAAAAQIAKTGVSASGSGAMYRILTVIPTEEGTEFRLTLGDGDDAPHLTGIEFRVDPTVELATSAAKYAGGFGDDAIGSPDDDDAEGDPDDGDDD